jgi:hypothetical protein
MPQRLSILALAIAAAILLVHSGDGAAASRGPAPAQEHRGPPWRGPVASSQTLAIGGAMLQVDFGPGTFDLPKAQILDWVRHAATAVTTYYGRFPVPRDRILINPAPDRAGVFHGTTWGDVSGFPAFTRIYVGQHSSVDDWMMTHELIHGAFPSQDDDHHWIEEGSAVYIEPIARVQAAYLKPEQIWADMVRDMPKGDPEPGDRGLDHTPTWGRTYWGGAQFCLLADVTIREKTHNRFGLEDALRAVMKAGGTIDQEWPLEKAFAIGDRATGTHVLEDLDARMANAPVPVDLDGLWKKLGVVRVGEDEVRFDDSAPEAAIRKAITR